MWASLQANSACQPHYEYPVRICIIQSCYVPWRGFFDLIGQCDEYVVFDRVQYVKRHWHNRNRIKTANGVEWLTIPVVSKGRFDRPIDEVEIENPWADKHWRALELAYGRAAFFEQFAPVIKACYEMADQKSRLTDVNEYCFLASRGYSGSRRASAAIRSIRLRAARRSDYSELHVPSALIAISAARQREVTSTKRCFCVPVTPEWMTYQGYPEYPQLTANSNMRSRSSISSSILARLPAFSDPPAMRSGAVAASNCPCAFASASRLF